MSRFHDHLKLHLISFTFEAHNLLPSCICQPFKRLSFTLWSLQIYWSGIVVILQVKSSTKLQKYTLYFSKCCFKLREFALKVPRYLSNYLLFFVSDTLWKPHGNTFLITKTNICRIHLLHAWISDLVRFLPQCEKGFVRFFGLYFCFADNLDFLTLPRCHLSKLGLLRNNCQIITQVGVHERAGIVFICRKIQVLLHSMELNLWCEWISSSKQ